MPAEVPAIPHGSAPAARLSGPSVPVLSLGGWLGFGRPWGRCAVAALLALLTGLVLPAYLLDDSIALKQVLSPAIAVLGLAWLGASRYGGRWVGGALQLLLLVFVTTYAISLGVSAVTVGITPNAAYPLLLVVFCLRKPGGLRPLLFGLLVGLAAVTLLGWYRFISSEGGVIGEHALGYWGIKYTEATRNNDALVPVLVSAIALAALQRLPQRGAAAGRTLLWVALLLGLPALALTFARSAWITVIVFLVLQSRSQWRELLRLVLVVAVAGAALLGLGALLMPDLFEQAVDLVALLERLQSIYDPSISSSNLDRKQLLSYGALLGLAHPVVGAGAGQFACCFADLGFGELAGALHPENLILHLFSEFGLLPALSAAAAIAVAVVRGLTANDADRRTAAGMLAALMVFLQMNSELPSLVVWVLLGALAGAAAGRQRPAPA
jgi:O-antigen ligase